MIGKDFARKVLEQAVSLCPADSVVALISGGKRAATRFQGEYIHQSMIQKDYQLMVLATVAGKTGAAECNDFSPASIHRTAREASLIARIQTHPGRFTPANILPEYPERSVYDESILEMSTEERANLTGEVMAEAGKIGFKALGYYSQGDKITALMSSSSKNMAYHTQTWDSFSVTVENTQGGSGHAFRAGHLLNRKAPMEAYSEALEVAKLNINPTTIQPGHFRAVLAPAAVAELLDYFCYVAFGGGSCAEGRSFISDKLGKKIISEEITLVDDTSNPLTPGIPFDYEGCPRGKTVFVDAGRAITPALDSRTAAQAKLPPTGHGTLFPSSQGPFFTNVLMSPGKSSMEKLVSDVRDGILINTFFYTNIVDSRRATITSMTRDGTMIIKDGKIAGACDDLRVNIDIPSLLSGVIGIGDSGQGFGTIATTWAPAIAVESLHVTGTKPRKT